MPENQEKEEVAQETVDEFPDPTDNLIGTNDPVRFRQEQGMEIKNLLSEEEEEELAKKYNEIERVFLGDAVYYLKPFDRSSYQEFLQTVSQEPNLDAEWGDEISIVMLMIHPNFESKEQVREELKYGIIVSLGRRIMQMSGFYEPEVKKL